MVCKVGGTPQGTAVGKNPPIGVGMTTVGWGVFVGGTSVGGTSVGGGGDVGGGLDRVAVGGGTGVGDGMDVGGGVGVIVGIVETCICTVAGRATKSRRSSFSRKR